MEVPVRLGMKCRFIAGLYNASISPNPRPVQVVVPAASSQQSTLPVGADPPVAFQRTMSDPSIRLEVSRIKDRDDLPVVRNGTMAFDVLCPIARL